MYVAFSLAANRIRIILYRGIEHLRFMIEYIVLASAIINVALLIGFFYEARSIKTVVSLDKIADLLTDLVDSSLERVQTDQEIQKRIYIIGGLLGQGIKASLGVSAKPGKFKFQDLLGALAGQFIQGIIPQIAEAMPQQATNSPNATSTM